jgi:hypothetical protein
MKLPEVTSFMAALRNSRIEVVKWMVNHVAHFPSDAELIQCEINVDEETFEKCHECVMHIWKIKDELANKANLDASPSETRRTREPKPKPEESEAEEDSAGSCEAKGVVEQPRANCQSSNAETSGEFQEGHGGDKRTTDEANNFRVVHKSNRQREQFPVDVKFGNLRFETQRRDRAISEKRSRRLGEELSGANQQRGADVG